MQISLISITVHELLPVNWRWDMDAHRWLRHQLMNETIYMLHFDLGKGMLTPCVRIGLDQNPFYASNDTDAGTQCE